MDYGINAKKQYTSNSYTAQGLIDMFAAYEEARGLLEEQEENTSEHLVNLDTHQTVDFEQVHTARIYPTTRKKQTIESAQLNIDEMWQKCIMGSRVLYAHTVKLSSKLLQFLMVLDNKIAIYIDAILAKHEAYKVSIQKRYTETSITVSRIGEDIVKSVPIQRNKFTPRKANMENQSMDEQPATKMEMCAFVLTLIVRRVMFGERLHNIDK